MQARVAPHVPCTRMAQVAAEDDHLSRREAHLAVVHDKARILLEREERNERDLRERLLLETALCRAIAVVILLRAVGPRAHRCDAVRDLGRVLCHDVLAPTLQPKRDQAPRERRLERLLRRSKPAR